MLKRKLSTIILAATITNMVSTPINVLAETLNSAVVQAEGNQGEEKTGQVIISKFNLYSNELLQNYNEVFKMDNSNIKSITNNGGKYASSTIDKAIDGNFQTHWETGTPNSATLTNEVVIELEDATTLNRIVYGARRDAGGKGFAQAVEIYASNDENNNEFTLVAEGTYGGSSLDIVEIKFAPTEFKKLKFVFKNATQGWASASEFMLYKEDTVSDKMSKLFTDETLSIVSAEFNSIEKINALDEEVKTHPLYENFKENIENAKLIIQGNNISYSDAKVSNFKDFNSEELIKYNELFKVSPDKVTSITTNGGHYGSSNIEKAMDGDVNTSWHSGKQNTSDFTNEVVITLNEITTLNRVVYTGSQSAHRGFAEAFDIYVSTTSKGDTFELVTSGTASRTYNSVEIKFNPTEVKRMKFVFKKGYENWALASEFGLYTQDETSEKVDRLFTNGLMTEVSEEFNTIEKINELEIAVNEHPLKDNLLENIQLAKEIVNNPNIFENTRIVTAEQRGRYREEMALRSINGAAYASFESIGKYVTAGEEIVVYVDADANGILPQLCFGQVGRGEGDWRRWVNLQPGKNVITVPSGINPSAIYVVNHAKPEEQAYAPRVRVEGGTEFPIYIHGETDPNEFYNELKEYAAKVEYSDEAFANGNPEGKFFNIAELVSENCVITTSAMGALAGLNEVKAKDLTVYDTMEEWEEMYDMFQTFQGLSKDAEKEEDSYFPNKFVARVFNNVPLGFADHGYTGYLGSKNEERDGGFFKLIAMPITYSTNDNWCYTHEFGHIFNSQYIVDGEVTNNLYAQEYRRIKGLGGDRANWNEIMKRFQGEDFAMHYFERLAVLSQLNIAYGYDAYAKASQALRDNKELITSIKGNDVQRLVVAYSLGLNVDLLDFFKEWNYCNIEITEQMREVVSHLPKPDKKIEYLHSGAYDYAGDGFTEDIEVSVTIKSDDENNSATLNFAVDKNNTNDVLGYEIFKDGEYLGYTKNNSFVDKEANSTVNSTYSVIAYAKDLSTANAVEIKTQEPSLLVTEKVTVKLNEEFNPLDYVNAFDYVGNPIEDIKVSGQVDTSKHATYEVNFEISDRGTTKKETAVVEVVSGYDHLSDKEWTSATTQYGTIRKNSNLKLLVNGKVKTFEKGFGIHANGEIVYDLSGNEYDKFEALVGIDRNIAEQDNSSVIFTVLADGKEVYNSGLMKYNTNAKTISIDIREVQELKIIINNGGNGNTSDHTVIADVKLTSNDTRPTIVSEDRIYLLGEDINLMEGVTASDIEDGDLTSKIEIISNTYEENKLGRFEVIYRVTDSNNNVTEKNSYIIVYEEFNVTKSKYGQFDTLNEYNEEFKIPVVSISNNGGNYGSSVISNAIDGNVKSHWETGRPNNNSFKNEVIFDLGQVTEIDKIGYAARSGGKGFATSFEIYVSTEEDGNDFILAGTGSYNGSRNDVIEIDIAKTEARRVKFKFVEAYDSWASIGEMSFYKTDELADKIANELFTDESKNVVTESYNTLEKLESLRNEVSNHPAASLFESDLNKAEEIIRASFPVLSIPKSESTKLGIAIDLEGGYTAIDKEDGDITSSVEIIGEVNFNKAGEYTITYRVTDSDGNTTEGTRTIAVVDMNDYSYLTEYNWKSTNNSYTAPIKDKSISGRALRLTGEDGQEVSYERGIGAHSTSTIIYDLADKNYDYFTSYVGVDRQMYNTVGSVSFEVYVDGEKKFDSGLMNSKDPQKFIEVDINGAKELKLVVTDGKNGNGSDHATWGDSKLHYANSESVEVNRGELDNLLEVVNGLDSNKYLGESFDNLQAIVEEVKVNLADGYNQEEIYSLYTKLNDAYEALIKLADFSQLELVLNKVVSIDREIYTEETLNVLDKVIEMANAILSDNTIAQEAVDTMVEELQTAIESLELTVDLTQIVNIKDKQLKKAIIQALELTTNNITVGDMYKLISLDAEGVGIISIEGLQYAKNLERLNLDHNEIQDISKLRELKKLKDFSIVEQYVAVGMANIVDGKITIKEDVLDIAGERMMPKEITVGSFTVSKNLDIRNSLYEGKIIFDANELYNGVNSIWITYESLDGKYKVQTLYMTRK